MKKNYFLWSEPSLLRGLFPSYRFTSTNEIENKLKKMFPSGFPILCSSGRTALVLALIESNLTRVDLVGIFPYASHCVLESISRVATPLAGNSAIKASIRVAYHQWGYVQEKTLENNAIEDCVDSLCVPGAKLFPGGGRFEVWSLPKILGTTSGGVLWCKNEETAKKIRYLRDSRKGGLFHWLLRLLALKIEAVNVYWHGAESDKGSISRFQTGEIMIAIKKWDVYVKERLNNLEKIWPFALEFLDKPVDRLPSVVPIFLDLSEREVKNYGISSGYRMFERVKDNNERELLKVIPVPIHHDVTEAWLDDLREKFSHIHLK